MCNPIPQTQSSSFMDTGGVVVVGSIVDEEEDKTTSDTVVPNLPADVISEILKRVPAELLFDSLRYVCKPWFHTITDDPVFQREHLDHHRHSSKEPPTLLIQENNRYKPIPEEMFDNPPLLVQTTTLTRLGQEEQEQEKFDDNEKRKHHQHNEVVDLSHMFQGLEIWDCCNGLVLVSYVGHCDLLGYPPPYNRALYVINPVTKKRVRLPCCNCKFPDYIHRRAKLMFLPSTQQYKVMRIVAGGVSDKSLLLPRNRQSLTLYLEVLTFSAGIGPSSHEDFQWRVIEAPDLHREPDPLPINGYVHFAEHGMGEVVSFDALAEKFYTARIPDYNHHLHYHDQNDFDPDKHTKHMDLHREECFLEVGGYFSYVRIRAHLQYPEYPGWKSSLPPPQLKENQTQYQLIVWILKDVQKGEWVKLYTAIIDTDFMAYDPRYYLYYVYRRKSYHKVGEKAALSYGENGETIIFINRREQAVRVCNVKTNRSWNLLANDEKNYCQFIGYYFNTLSSFKSPLTR